MIDVDRDAERVAQFQRPIERECIEREREALGRRDLGRRHPLRIVDRVEDGIACTHRHVELRERAAAEKAGEIRRSTDRLGDVAIFRVVEAVEIARHGLREDQVARVEIAARRVDLSRGQQSCGRLRETARERLGRHVVQVSHRGRILAAHRGDTDTGDESQSSSKHSIPHP
jgi:hypothetical protein